MKKLISGIFPLGLALLFLVGIVGDWSISRLRQTIRSEELITRLHDKADEIHDLVLAAESSERAYLLNQDPVEYERFQSVRQQTPTKIDELISLTGEIQRDNSENDQRKLASEVRALIQTKFDELGKNIDAAKSTFKEDLKKIPTDLLSDQKTIEAIRERLNYIKEESKLTSNQHSSSILTESTFLIYLISLASLLSVALFVANLMFTRRQLNTREKEKQEIAEAKALSQESSDLKSKFLATVSHEIRTPLNGIIGLSDVLRKSKLPQAELRMIDVIHSSGKTLLNIINDILDFSRIESGKIDLELASFSLMEIADQVITTLSSRAADKGILIDCIVDENLPESVVGDSSRISQVLFNLVGNAIKFTSSGSVVLKIRNDPASDFDRVRIVFSVEDTGIGIASNQLNKLFQPFNQIHKVGTSGEAGTGLGLSISQYLIRQMGGEIKVSSEIDRGSKFWFALDFGEFSKEKINPNRDLRGTLNKSGAIRPIFADSNIPTVLVAEDNIANQITIQTMLNKLGIDVVLASNGTEAIDFVQKIKIDLIFMDCQMPVMDGFDATREIKKFRNTVPVVAMTANASKDDERNCYAAGMDGFVTKPITVDTLTQEVIRWLRPGATLILDKALQDLEEKIGLDGKTKVVRAFIKELHTLREALDSQKSSVDFESLHRLAHKYKSSSQTVGATGLAYLCKQLETENRTERVQQLAQQIYSATEVIERDLTKQIDFN